jgi:hypothetical protein
MMSGYTVDISGSPFSSPQPQQQRNGYYYGSGYLDLPGIKIKPYQKSLVMDCGCSSHRTVSSHSN